MCAADIALPLPPRLKTAEGKLRRIGVELEFTGLDISTISRLVSEHVGGEVKVISPYEHEIMTSPYGPYHVELDFAYLKKKGLDEAGRASPPDAWDEVAERLIKFAAEHIVPYEVVTPPLPMAELGSVDGLIDRLRRAGAQGTEDGLTFAFGLQLNPELPALDAPTVLAYLKAFLCLYEWLDLRACVDWTRRLTPYVDAFPRRYVRRVVDPAYWPDLEQLIDDYLADNPTRNRALDMLPLFCFLDEPRVRRSVPDPRVKSRPTLHYRLPNCEIDEPGWGVGPAWRDWLEVERLAGDAERLEDLCRKYVAHLDDFFASVVDDWGEMVGRWL